MSQRPTKKEIEAVRGVLYKHGRVEKISELVHNIVVLMNLNPSAVVPGSDPRYPAGSGPQWYFPDNGSLDNAVIESAGYCDQLAALSHTMRHEISNLSLPAADRRHLMTALSENANVWTMRARLWRAAKPPADPNAAAASIAQHVTASLDALKHLKPYLKSPHEFGLE
jgi:hypothetical protein